MKSIAKLTLLALALFASNDHQANAITLNQRNTHRMADEGDVEAAAAEEEAPATEEADAPKAEKAAAAAPAGKDAEAAPAAKEGEKAPAKKGGKGKEPVKDAAAEADALPQPATLSSPGASAGQSHTVDAMAEGPCEEALNITEYEMIKQMEYFSRRLEKEYFENAITIWKNLTKEGRMDRPLMVHTWELMDKAFDFPRVRRYTFVQENLDMLEHFEDNLNTNISNRQNLANFLRVANTVRHNLNTKYGKDGGFNDPALTDPYEEKPETWATAKLPEPVY